MSRFKVAAVVTAVALVGFWLAKAMLFTSTSARPTTVGEVPVVGRGPAGSAVGGDARDRRAVGVVPAGEVSGVAVGYPPTVEGAAAAAVNWVGAFPALMESGPIRLGATLSTVFSERYAAVAVEGMVVSRLELAGGVGTGDRVWIESPLQASVISWSSTAAVVAVWSSMVTGDAVSGPIEVLWRTHDVSLVWERADWRIDGLVIQEGPTPVTVVGALPSGPEQFVEVGGWRAAVLVHVDARGAR